MNHNVTIIVPTYKEVSNLLRLVDQIEQSLQPLSILYQILIVDDDSKDGTEELVNQLSQQHPVQILVRRGVVQGLSESVIDGLKQIQQKPNNQGYVFVMDADLSHPPAEIPAMLNYLQHHENSFVIGSRFVTGSSIDTKWSFARRVNSRIATWLAKPLVNINDPMSGFFGFHANNLPNLDCLKPIGYKIGLEILVKGEFNAVKEHAIQFQDRELGESKLTFKQQLLYIRHLRRLYQYKFSTWAELTQFAIVGSLGVVVDLFFYFSLQLFFSIPHEWARAISFWPAVTHNWLLNRLITFNHRVKQQALKQWRNFVITALVGFTINWGTYQVLTNHLVFFSNHPIFALIIGILMGMGFNFLFSNIFVFHNLREEQRY